MILKVITYLDEINIYSKILRESCKKNNIKLEYCGLDIPYEKTKNIKIEWMKSYFKKNKNLKNKEKTILLFLDGHDTKIKNNFDEQKLINRFKDYDCDILFSSENASPKFNENKDNWFLYNYFKKTDFFKKFNIKSKKDFAETVYNKLNFENKNKLKHWCNNGAIIGYYKSIEKYVNIIDKVFKENVFKKTWGPTGDSCLYYYALLSNRLKDINIKIESKKKIFFTYNEYEFTLRQKKNTLYDIPYKAFIYHFTSCDGSYKKNNLKNEIYHKI